MPSLIERRPYVYRGPKPSPAQRLERWIRKKAEPPAHISYRPLLYRLPKKIMEANRFDTADVWLTACGELRLDDPVTGKVLGNI